MPKPTRHEMLTLALGVLPHPPTEVEVLSEDGGAFPLRIIEQEGDLLHAFAPRQQVRRELHLLARVTDERRGRYEVEFEIEETYFHSGAEALVHAAVSGVRHRKMRRSSPRVPVTERTNARVLFCRSLPRHHTIDVRLSDVSTTGIGFTSVNELAAGDLLVVTVTLSGKPVDVETRVVRVDPAPYGRFRIGGEITELAEVDRRLIAEMAMRTPEAGSEAERGSGSAAGASLMR
jgi:PilZ domain